MMKSLLASGAALILISAAALAQAPPAPPPATQPQPPPNMQELSQKLSDALTALSQASQTAAANGSDQLKANIAMSNALGAYLNGRTWTEQQAQKQIDDLQKQVADLKKPGIATPPAQPAAQSVPAPVPPHGPQSVPARR